MNPLETNQCPVSYLDAADLVMKIKLCNLIAFSLAGVGQDDHDIDVAL